jgi:hypothetical protein
MHDDGYFDERVAASYDRLAGEEFDPRVQARPARSSSSIRRAMLAPQSHAIQTSSPGRRRLGND